MATYSETILERYKAREEEIDGFGRAIVVQRLRPWDEAMVRKVANSDTLSVTSMILVAACVREIRDDSGKVRQFAPPKTEDDAQVIMNALDQEGLAAALKAYSRLMGVKSDSGLEGEEAVIDAAKNSPATEG